jgi:hypothetical protein
MRVGSFLAFFAILVLGAVGFLYGGRLLTERHTVARYVYKIPVNSVSTDVIQTGLRTAMEHNRIDPSIWAVVSQRSEGLRQLQSGSPQYSGLITLSNRVDRTILYARITSIQGAHALLYHVYRPK